MNDKDIIPANRYNLLDFDQVRTFKTVLQDTYNSTLKTFIKYVFHSIAQMDLRNKNPGTGPEINISPEVKSQMMVWSTGYEHSLCSIDISARYGFQCKVRMFFELHDITPGSAHTLHLNILRSNQVHALLQNLINTEVDYLPEMYVLGTPSVSPLTACDWSTLNYLRHNYSVIQGMALKAPLFDVRNDDELFNAIMTMTRDEMFHALVGSMYGVRPSVLEGLANFKMVSYGMHHNLAVYPHMLSEFNLANEVTI